MPHFFFNLQDGGDGFVDQEGVELQDLGAVKTYAIKVARELMQGNAPNRRHWQLDVLDSEGRLAVAVSFAKVDPMLNHLSGPLRLTIEQLSETRRRLAETIRDLERLRLQLQAMRARCRRQPYLIAQNGRRL